MDEFSLIEHYFAQPSKQSQDENTALLLGIGDDCAVVRAPLHQDLVFSIDTMVEAVHFPRDAAPARIAWRLLSAAVSDLAAMGAKPSCFTLALTIPELSSVWLREFSQGLAAAAQHYDITLAGGDTTKGPLTLSIQVQGFVKEGKALLRSGAQVNDFICVSGFLGDSRAGLEFVQHQQLTPAQEYLLARYYEPSARVGTGLMIADFASACIDISDGFLADLNHVLTRSKVGAIIDTAAIPLSSALRSEMPEQALNWALSGGEDFELCFSVAPEHWSLLQKLALEQGVKITKVGEVVVGEGIKVLQNGQCKAIDAAGYNHFSN